MKRCRLSLAGASGIGLALALLLARPAAAQETPPVPEPGAPAAATPAPATPAAAPRGDVVAPKYASKGVMELGGNFVFSYQKGGTYSLGFDPGFFYFLIPNLEVGGFFRLSYDKTGDDSLTRFGFLPGAQYIFDLGSRLYPYAGMALGFEYVSGGAGSYFAIDVMGGVKYNFGGGLLGFGLDFPIWAGSETWYAISLMTSYAVYF
jgi:hypothetical protein